jgi:hypothetical protein
MFSSTITAAAIIIIILPYKLIIILKDKENYTNSDNFRVCSGKWSLKSFFFKAF